MRTRARFRQVAHTLSKSQGVLWLATGLAFTFCGSGLMSSRVLATEGEPPKASDESLSEALGASAAPAAKALPKHLPPKLPPQKLTEAAVAPTTAPQTAPQETGLAPAVATQSPSPESSPGSASPEASVTKPTANLNLEWEQVDEAAAYEIKLTPKEPSVKGAEQSLVFKTETPSFSGRVPIGVYRLQVRSKDKTSGYFGKWSAPAEIEVVSKVIELLEPRNEAVVATAKSRRSSVMFQWTPVAEARAYTLKLWSDDPTKIYEFKSRTPTLSLNLITGREYHWQVTFESKARIGYHASPQVFGFKLLGPQLLTPVIDEKLGLPVVEALKWSASPEAQSYEAKLFRHALDETAWEPYRELANGEATRWAFTKLPPGVYRAEVVAHASHRVSSEAGVIEFVVKPTVTDLESALQTAMKSAGGVSTPVLAPIKSDERETKAEPPASQAENSAKSEFVKPEAKKSVAPKGETFKAEASEAKAEKPSSTDSSPSSTPSSEDDLSLDDLDN